MTKKITEQTILDLYEQYPTMSYKDMALRLNCSKGLIQYWFKALNIKRDRKIQQKINNTNRNKPIVISTVAKEILTGTLLGDSSITKYNRNCESAKILNSCITCGHGVSQKNYALYLQRELCNAGILTHYREDLENKRRIVCGKEIISEGRCDIQTIRNINFNSWRDTWYPNGIKVVPQEIENFFSARCVAFWFMDDGSKSGRTNEKYYVLHTEGFTIEDVEFLRKLLFEKLHIETMRHSNRGKPIIYIKSCSRDLFTSLIEPYICDCMKYKLIKTIGSE